jgi:tripartite-type tricarboxylate transporter receptor subunit TctC
MQEDSALAPALNDLMGGMLTGLVLTLGDMVKHAQAGKLRILASTGTRRSAYAPNVGTFAQQGVQGLEMSDWFGVYIAGQPTPVLARDTAALVQRALRSPAYVSGLRAAFLEAASSSPQELDQLAKADHARWGPLVKATGFVADV